MDAYAPMAWHDFFVGSVGAAAGLTGLLFVAISLNLEHILKFPHLPGMAAGTLGVVVATLLVAGFALAPGQSNRVLGIEMAVTGVVVSAQAVVVSVRNRQAEDPLQWTLARAFTLVPPGLFFVAGGLSLVAGGGGGLEWILAGTLASFVAAPLNAWVLLVEILR
jgi:hypothetical protein